MSTEEFRDHIRKALKGRGDEKNIEAFLKMCIYTPGNYGDTEAMQRTVAELEKHEGESKSSVANRLYYFAIPPSVFVPTGNAIKVSGRCALVGAAGIFLPAQRTGFLVSCFFLSADMTTTYRQ